MGYLYVSTTLIAAWFAASSIARSRRKLATVPVRARRPQVQRRAAPPTGPLISHPRAPRR